MPLTKGQYVRFWDGSAVTYGVIAEVRLSTYCVRIGGTDTIVELPHPRVALHPVLVATGALLGPLTSLRFHVGDKYLYHATSWELLPSIVTKQALVPRSRVHWKSLGDGVWTGAEKAANRVQSVTVREKGYFGELVAAAEKGGFKDDLLLGDVGEFFYAALRHDDVLINYVVSIFNAGKAPVVARFKGLGLAWYRDPKSTAVMTMNSIPLGKLQMTYIPKKLKGIEKETELINYLGEDKYWVDCSEEDWFELLKLENQLD